MSKASHPDTVHVDITISPLFRLTAQRTLNGLGEGFVITLHPIQTPAPALQAALQNTTPSGSLVIQTTQLNPGIIPHVNVLGSLPEQGDPVSAVLTAVTEIIALLRRAPKTS